MITVQIKPLSINEAYYGVKKSTTQMRKYKLNVCKQLVAMKIPDKIHLTLEFGFSSKGSDIDNCIKVFTDCLQLSFGFNDNQIYRLSAHKVIVPKKKEYIKFSLVEYIEL